jgi:anti-sigma factor RsiW
MTGREGKPIFEIDEAALEAFADGKLAGVEADAVAAFLARNPDKAAEIESWQRQNAAINALFAPVANEPVPARLRVSALAAAQVTQRSGIRRFATAAMVLLALGASIGWFGHDLLLPAEAASDILIENAVTAHALYINEKRHAVEVAASEEDHLVSWLSNRIGQTIDAPDLAAQGFTLVGGRLLPPDPYADAGPAAQLMYENATADRLTVYVTAALPDKEAAYEFAAIDAFDAFYWANDAITCTVVGSLPEAEMQVVAKQVYTQLTWRPDPATYKRGT